ncbi:MAG TPA: hypothetical protein VFR38_13170 [Gaiellaceae bacterium]|nr:hypothetical protein [Gaiellaceae bacterium]
MRLRGLLPHSLEEALPGIGVARRYERSSAWTYLDAAAIDTLEQLHDELAERGVTVAVARLKGPERETFLETRLTAKSAQTSSSRPSARLSMRSRAVGALHGRSLRRPPSLTRLKR